MAPSPDTPILSSEVCVGLSVLILGRVLRWSHDPQKSLSRSASLLQPPASSWCPMPITGLWTPTSAMPSSGATKWKCLVLLFIDHPFALSVSSHLCHCPTSQSGGHGAPAQTLLPPQQFLLSCFFAAPSSVSGLGRSGQTLASSYSSSE